MTSSFADVRFKKDAGAIWVDVTETISPDDAKEFAQHRTDFEYNEMYVFLNSSGGNVEAAMQIGRIIRSNDGHVSVATNAMCYSSCGLIYISGVVRQNLGVIGIHRPFFASAPQKRQDIERQFPLMLRRLRAYVKEMGITDNFYQEMVNTDPSDIRLYNGNTIDGVVPQKDPTYDEIKTAADAREYGVADTSEMRKRNEERRRCGVDLVATTGNPFDDIGPNKCDALLWGLSERVYEQRLRVAQNKCIISLEEMNILTSAKRAQRLDHPIFLKYEACMRSTMLGL